MLKIRADIEIAFMTQSLGSRGKYRSRLNDTSSNVCCYDFCVELSALIAELPFNMRTYRGTVADWEIAGDDEISL
jgi:hypothetical protein